MHIVNRPVTRIVLAGLSALLFLTSGCGKQPSAPSPSPITPLTVTSVHPTSGPLDSGVPVNVIGTGFQTGATVTLDGIPATVTSVSSTVITVMAPGHAPATVDVVVTNPGGERGRLAGAYTYLLLSVSAISPNLGSTDGGTLVKIEGTGLLQGAIVTLDGARLQSSLWEGALFALTQPHAAGTVNVEVTIGGATARLAAAYTFASPSSFDFNGDWAGWAFVDEATPDLPLRFTIQGNVLTSVSCGTSGTLILEPGPSITNGQFALAASGVNVSGRIVATGQARGSIAMAPCGTRSWDASKQ